MARVHGAALSYPRRVGQPLPTGAPAPCQAGMTPHDFIARYRNAELKERSASQSRFIDLCRLPDIEHAAPLVSPITEIELYRPIMRRAK